MQRGIPIGTSSNAQTSSSEYLSVQVRCDRLAESGREVTWRHYMSRRAAFFSRSSSSSFLTFWSVLSCSSSTSWTTALRRAQMCEPKSRTFVPMETTETSAPTENKMYNGTIRLSTQLLSRNSETPKTKMPSPVMSAYMCAGRQTRLSLLAKAAYPRLPGRFRRRAGLPRRPTRHQCKLGSSVSGHANTAAEK